MHFVPPFLRRPPAFALALLVGAFLAIAAPNDAAVRALTHTSGPVADWRADPLAAARDIAEDLRRRGRLQGEVAFALLASDRSTGTARWDFAADRCEVRIAPLAGDSYTSPLAFRFLVHHELAHCELYRAPGGLFRQVGLSPAGERLLDDFVILDTIDYDVPAERPDFFALAHETYADLRAAALLVEAGVPPSALAWVVRMREAAWADVDHRSDGALARLLASDPATFTGPALEAAVRAATGDHLLREVIGSRVVAGPHEAIALDELVRARMGSAFGRMRHGILAAEVSVAGAVHLPSAIGAYPVLQTFFAESARWPRLDDRAAFVAHWMTDVYAGDMRREGSEAGAALARYVTALRVGEHGLANRVQAD